MQFYCRKLGIVNACRVEVRCVVNLRPMTFEDELDIANIRLHAQQLKFAGTSTEFLADNDDSTDRHVIMRSGQVVGYFKIDKSYFDNYDFCPQHALGLRSVVVDQAFQGQGIGLAAMKNLPTYLAELYPEYRAVYLTVNVKNITAKNCYLAAGFEDLKQLYLGGSAGPQHIMVMVLLNNC